MLLVEERYNMVEEHVNQTIIVPPNTKAEAKTVKFDAKMDHY